MKIVDQTPFYKENGELSLIDRAKAILQFGPGWFKEIEAQKLVIAVLKKTLDKNYTLLCNIIPPGLDARIPLILVGPTGVYVMTVTPKIGMFRARGDQWGTVSGNAFRPENPNLLTLTEKMARAIQVYLQRHGYADLTNVEAALLCSDPATNVDSMRPIIRVIMRDSLERFAVSITQARIVLNPESAFDIVNRLLNPPPPPPSKPVEPAEPAAPEAGPTCASQPSRPNLTFRPSPCPVLRLFLPPPETLRLACSGRHSTGSPVCRSRPRSRLSLTRKQIILLVGMARHLVSSLWLFLLSLSQ